MIPDMFRMAVPLLVIVTDIGALVLFNTVLGNVRDVADSVTAGAVAVPVSCMTCGLSAALLVSVIVPVLVPVVVGENVTLMLQLAPGATDVPQLLVCA